MVLVAIIAFQKKQKSLGRQIFEPNPLKYQKNSVGIYFTTLKGTFSDCCRQLSMRCFLHKLRNVLNQFIARYYEGVNPLKDLQKHFKDPFLMKICRGRFFLSVMIKETKSFKREANF